MLLSRFKVVGHSMIPSLLPGDEILISSIPYFFSDPKPKDIILIKEPLSEKKVVKRVGKIEKEKIFVLGDNVKDSHDSRTYGYVTKKAVLGKMVGKL